ncbi:MAG TPA: glycoside hydrolase family 3 N-terminal domain-containing protein [Gaiellaceae bacterium]|nr:glycoside hydrolase family 3 N-terminal domain-containing protein [Gaiellaceae bacterium]
MRATLICLLCAGLLAGSAERARPASGPTLAQLVGQKLVVSMTGRTPSASLLARARRGDIGGVIVHSFNFSSSAQLRTIARALQQAAAAGGRPPLLIAVDQEGGSVKTIPWLPPARAPGHVRSSADARADGRATGVALLGLGVNTDLAPVADLPVSRASAVYRQGRTWSFDARTTARLATAFAVGIADGHALATMKHFPGLGFATADTDRSVVRITASRRQLDPGLDPYRSAIAAHLPLIMLSNAVYDAYDRTNAAGWSRAIATTLLRGELGFGGVTITDSLDGAAHTRRITPNVLALAATKAGTDLLLLTGGEESTRSDYTSLLRAAQAGRLGRPGLERSYARILRLKAALVPH